MPNRATVSGLADMIAADLPFLRRYARALTGQQILGDEYAAATLEAVLAQGQIFDLSIPPKQALFKVFHDVWQADGAPTQEGDTPLTAAAGAHLDKLSTDGRAILLLSVIEGFSAAEIGQITGLGSAKVMSLLDEAHQQMAASSTGRVMLIEDEAIIAMDIESIVSDLGHRVTGVARTRAGAVKLAAREAPDLILADVHLADDSSGIDAVDDIRQSLGDRPVIFITAYPERLLTGAEHEPAFLITKPYTEQQVRVAVSQAMFFASTETLTAR